MILQKHLLAFSSATAILACLSQPAVSAPWVRGFVVGTYEPAFRYGGRTGYARAGEIEPGSDCIHGNTIHFSNSEQIRRALSFQPWRSPEEIKIVSTLPGLEQAKTPDQARFMIWDRAMSYRGWRHGIETYINPFAAQDPGQPEVVSRIGDGFNLDGKIGAHDFVSPDGEKGIDNALYRAWGCDAPWRGNGNATLDMRSNDKMQEGLYTMVIRISGNQDPMNDKDATLEIGYSPDKIVKDARGIVTTDFSYRIAKTAQYTKMKARVANGVVETEQVAELHAPRIAWFYDHAGDAEFHQGRIRLAIDADGNAKGVIGGYRSWRDIYAQNTFAQDGGQQGVREHEDWVALYYALRRNADGMRDSKTGQNMGISTAYRITAAAAYVVDASKPAEITALAPEEKRREAYLRIVNNMKKATTTRIVQDVTPGTSEGAYPNMERDITGLPIADYLLKTLDRPHFDDPPGPQASK